MSVRVMADVWDSAMKGSTAVHVMAVLANSADDDGGNCFPGTRLIARRARVSERTVIRTIQELELSGYLKVLVRGAGAGRFSEYCLNVQRLHDEAEVTRALNREKRRHGVTFPARRRVTPAEQKGDTRVRKGDIGGAPLFVLPVIDPSQDSPPPYPLPREGARELAIERAVDQVFNALALGNKRRRPLLRFVIAQEADKGELPATTALAIVAAVREQDGEQAQGNLKYSYGISKFLGDGIWKDRQRWAWDVAAIRRQGEAGMGTMR